jgi:hypothetical protein
MAISLPFCFVDGSKRMVVDDDTKTLLSASQSTPSGVSTGKSLAGEPWPDDAINGPNIASEMFSRHLVNMYYNRVHG